MKWTPCKRNINFAPFCTHGGGGAGHIERDIKNLCPGAKVLPLFAAYTNSFKKGDVEDWIKSI